MLIVSSTAIMSRLSFQPVTVTTIAGNLGVAPSTVSAVLAGQAKKRRIQDTTAQRVINEAQRLNYIPNDLARGLRSRRTGVVGVIFADFTNNWADRVMSGINEVFDRRGSLAFIMTHRWDAHREERELQSLMQRRVDGIISVPLPGSVNTYESLMQRGTPLLFLSDTLGLMPQVSYVAWDSRHGVRVAVEHLLQIGRRKIAMLYQNWDSAISGTMRRQSFVQTLRDAGLEPDPRHMIGVDLDTQVEAAMRQMFLLPASQRPDALYANNDGLAFSALAALGQMGLRVPQDVLLVGMGDLPRGDEMGVGLTSVREPCEELGRLSAEAILDLIEKPSRPPIQRLVPGTELKIRRTTVVVETVRTQPLLQEALS